MSIADDEAEVARLVDKSLAETETNLTAAYLKAADDTRQRIADLYAKGVNTFAQAQRAGRFERLLKQIERDLERLTGKAYNLSFDQSVYAFQMGYNSVGFSVTNNTEVNWDFETANIKSIIASVQAPIDGVKLSARFTLQRYELLLRQRQTITQGLISGWSIDKMATAIDEIYSIGLNSAVRIARTETVRNNTEGQNAAYDDLTEMGVANTKKWIATKDGRTRHNHGNLDGKLADGNGYFWIGSKKAKGPGLFDEPKLSINCRCRIVTVLPEYQQEYPKYKDYNTWAKENGIKTVKVKRSS